MITVEFHRLGQCFIDWATAVVGKADRADMCRPHLPQQWPKHRPNLLNLPVLFITLKVWQWGIFFKTGYHTRLQHEIASMPDGYITLICQPLWRCRPIEGASISILTFAIAKYRECIWPPRPVFELTHYNVAQAFHNATVGLRNVIQSLSFLNISTFILPHQILVSIWTWHAWNIGICKSLRMCYPNKLLDSWQVWRKKNPNVWQIPHITTIQFIQIE